MKTIPLTQGKTAIVDDIDFEKVNQFKWHAYLNRNRWYALRKVRRPDGKETSQGMHRFILGLEHGNPHQVDHIDRVNTLDNRRENLRVTLGQNQQNIGITKGNHSGCKGVSWHKQREKWHARIKINSKQISLGLFATRELAAQARDEAALKYHGEFAVTNLSLGLLKKPVQPLVTFAQAA